jgi:hypothetical protein
LVIDEERIASFRSFEDRGLGIRESFVQPRIGEGRTVGVLSTPLDSTPLAGWVICHSFALEHVYLQPLETALARGLAATGLAVLRFHAHGYGDSELDADHVSLRSHVEDTEGAAGVLAEETGVARIGFAGIRLGGTVAALAADRLHAAGLVAVAPAVRGDAYIRSITNQARLTDLSDQEEAPPADPIAELRATGTLDVLGFPLRREVFDEIASLDLADRVGAFRGQALLLQVSRSPDPDGALQHLAERLRGLGASCDLEVLVDRAAMRFGLPRFRRSKSGGKEDTQVSLAESVIARVVEWCRNRRWGPAEVPV